ncbi:MAG: hypothetical protein ACLS4Z_11345 [Christensenellaceae bacterium]
MSGIWVVLSKTAVITWLIVLVSGSILAIVSGIVEYRELKNGKAETEDEGLEPLATEMTERGIVTKCSASNRCAAVTGILESEREYEQLRKEYDELRERYKNLRLAHDEKTEALESLEEADNKLTAEYKELKKENEAHWRQLTQIMRSNPEVFEQFSGADEVEQDHR